LPGKRFVKQICRATLTFCAGLGVQFIHQVDDREEPSTTAISDTGPGDADGEMGFAGASGTDQSLVDLGRFDAVLFLFLGQR